MRHENVDCRWSAGQQGGGQRDHLPRSRIRIGEPRELLPPAQPLGGRMESEFNQRRHRTIAVQHERSRIAQNPIFMDIGWPARADEHGSRRIDASRYGAASYRPESRPQLHAQGLGIASPVMGQWGIVTRELVRRNGLSLPMSKEHDDALPFAPGGHGRQVASDVHVASTTSMLTIEFVG